MDDVSSDLSYKYLICRPESAPPEYARVMVFESDDQKNQLVAHRGVACDTGFAYEGPGWMISPTEGDIAQGLEAAGYTRQDC